MVPYCNFIIIFHNQQKIERKMHWLNINTDDPIPNFILFVLTNFIYCSLCNQFYKLYRQRKILVFTTLSVKSKIELKASCIHFQSQNKPVTHYHHTLLSTSYKFNANIQHIAQHNIRNSNVFCIEKCAEKNTVQI